MFHALLHGKLDPFRPEPQRIEDALTSAVFGSLVWVEGWDLLRRWLYPTLIVPRRPFVDRDCWFWPRLSSLGGTVEPDVVLRLDDILVVVEAKLRSSRHDLPDRTTEEEIAPRDQLVRQYHSVATPVAERSHYVETLERAIAECRLVQVYVVDARRVHRARHECAESRELLPSGACLEVVTWQSLFRLLNGPDLRGARWATDLRAYLALADLDAYQGIRSDTAEPARTQPAVQWRSRSLAFGLHGGAVMTQGQPLTFLQRWRSGLEGGRVHSSHGFHIGVAREDFVRAISTWTSEWEKDRGRGRRAERPRPERSR